jgi:hypothetical protein
VAESNSEGQVLASFTLVRTLDNNVEIQLQNDSKALISSFDMKPYEKMLRLAMWIHMAAEKLAEEADKVRPKSS